MIILTAEQAEMVRGESKPGHVLNPRPLKDGSYCLSEAVLDDPAHEKWRTTLDALPKRDVTPSELSIVAIRKGGM